MREAMLLAVAILAFTGAAFVPGGAIDSAMEPHQEVASSAGFAAAAPPPSADGAAGYAAWVAGSIALPRAADGHFYAEATVDGTLLRFLVDTGASMVALTGDDARTLGLTWSEADIRTVAQGASGPVEGLVVQLDSIRIGGHEARGVEAMIIPQGLGISLLGQNFLGTVRPVRITGDEMVLGE